jgi:hypothetical protein
MKLLCAIAGLFVAGMAWGCPNTPVTRAYASNYVAPVYNYEPVVEVEFAFAHPVFNRVDVVEIRERQVFVPVIVTGQTIVQREVVEKVNVIRVKKVH